MALVAGTALAIRAASTIRFAAATHYSAGAEAAFTTGTTFMIATDLSDGVVTGGPRAVSVPGCQSPRGVRVHALAGP